MRRFGIASAGAAPGGASGRELFAGADVDLADAHVAVAIGEEINLSVVVKQQGRVDARLIDIDRVAPFARRIGRRNIEIPAAGDVGRDHVEHAVVPADGGGEDAAGGLGLLQRQLRGTGQAVPDLLPMHQILAVEHRHAGEEFKRRSYQIIVLSHAANAWVGIESRNNWILKMRHLLVPPIFL